MGEYDKAVAGGGVGMGTHYEDIEAMYQRPGQHVGTGGDGYIFHVVPCPAPRMTRADAWKDRPCVLRYRAYRDQVRLETKRLRFTLPAVLHITFVLPMPPSWSAKKRQKMNWTPHQQKPDRDNLLKAFQDSFEGDDGFVWAGRTTKVWGYEGKIIVEGP